MIGKLTGRFDGMTPSGEAIIEVNGVGYSVRVPLTILEEVRGQNRATLLIHTAVREDAIDLYGFKTEEELGFFKQLMEVKGVGPKTAISIMNVADAKTLRRAIARGDAAALTKVFGIGKRTAERIVVELRDKLAGEVPAGNREEEGDDGEVIEALLALGYSASESRKALKGVEDDIVGVQGRLRAALHRLGSGQKS